MSPTECRLCCRYSTIVIRFLSCGPPATGPIGTFDRFGPVRSENSQGPRPKGSVSFYITLHPQRYGVTAESPHSKRMSDDPFGICCSIAIIACLDVCAGICLDYASIRTSFFRLPLPWHDASLQQSMHALL